MQEEPFVISGRLEDIDDQLDEIDRKVALTLGHVTTSHHIWVDSLQYSDPDLFERIDRVRTYPALVDRIRSAFPGCAVVQVHEADELYWAVSAKTATGSDRSLVDCHYDAPFGNLGDLTRSGGGRVVFYRVILSCNENDSTVTVFPDADVRARMTTGDFHGLDYNRELHCVEGEIPPGKHRVLLKLHFLIVPPGTDDSFAAYVRWLNVAWTWASRELMRVATDPHTVQEHAAASLTHVLRISGTNRAFALLVACNVVCLLLLLLLLALIWVLGRKRRA